MRERSLSLFFIDETPAFDGIFKHQVFDALLKWELFLLNIRTKLIQSDPIIEINVNRIAQLADALYRNLQGRVPLVQILGRAAVVAALAKFLHCDLSELFGRFLGVTVDYRDLLSRLLQCHLFPDFVHNRILASACLLFFLIFDEPGSFCLGFVLGLGFESTYKVLGVVESHDDALFELD